ncbi:MAG: ribonuclease H-like domain-containing protein [Candidatus Aminicenantes bacterium]|nr:ribonuclease H-like domain-containing protein [Candidatus Aminicenantes bacterium]
MDIDDIREAIRKKNRHQSTDQIKEIWKNIENQKNLTTREKLEKLLEISRQKKEEKKPEPRVPVEELRSRQPRSPYLVVENNYHLGDSYGQIPISLGLNIPGRILSVLSRDPAFENLSLQGALLLDLETTGLAGGAGTVPFLIGVGYLAEDSFKVQQFFLQDLADEGRMLEEFQALCAEKKFHSVISYNGKGYDVPLLETRFVLNRLRFPLAGLPHLDFLFSARHLWKHKYESCRLYHLALEHLGASRSEDIPSEEIPWRYFQFLRTGDLSLVEPIIYHNQEDILSLYGVVVAGAVMVSQAMENLGQEADGLDLLGVGKILEKAGELEKSVTFYEKALNSHLPSELSVKLKKNLASHFKRCGDFSRAVELWLDLVEHSEDLECFRELAVYYEHQAKNPEEALKYALDGLALARGYHRAYEQDFQRRVERLSRKLEILKSSQK